MLHGVVYSLKIFHLSAQQKSNRTNVSLKTLPGISAHARARVYVLIKTVGTSLEFVITLKMT